jgi:hypothetical protein
MNSQLELEVGALENRFAVEHLRQQKETFNQHKSQATWWFALRLSVGFISIFVLLIVCYVAAHILLNSTEYPTCVVTIAASALFIDTLGILGAVWKIVIAPSSSIKLQPITPMPTSKLPVAI